MANINKIKVGSVDPDAIMFDKYYTNKSDYKFNFEEWIDTGNAVMTVTNNRIVITKFKPNVWLLHSPTLLKGTNCDEVCNYCRGTRISVTGLAANSSLFNSYFTTSTTTGAGGDVGKLRGLCFYPFSSDGLFLTCHLNYWDHVGIDSEGNTTLPQIPDMIFEGGLRLDGNGRNQYGLFNGDKKNKLIFPDELYGFNNTQGYSYYYAFGLYTNNLTSVGEDGYIDISANPITIDLIVDKGIDITNVECWNVYCGDTKIYHKDKTLENCWKKYGLATTKYTDDDGEHEYANGRISVSISSDKTPDSGIKMPDIVDLDKYIKQVGEDGVISGFITWNISIKNTEFWDTVREWYKDNTVNSTIINSGLFKNSNITGDITLNINNIDDYEHNKLTSEYMTAIDFMNGSSIENITINIASNHRFSVGQNMFRGAKNLKYATINSPIGATDCSGMFEFCAKLTSYDSNFIDWGNRGNLNVSTGGTNMCYCFEYTGLTSIPSYNSQNRFADNNTIICLPFIQQMFNDSNDLTTIGPVIDIGMVNPSVDGNAKNAFRCPNLTDARIKGLNHANWYLDGTNTGNSYHGNLSKLNAESVEYLFKHMADLTTHIDGRGTIQYNNSFSSWDGNVSVDADIVVNGEMIGYKSFTSCVLGKRFNTGENANSPCHTNQRFTGLKIKVSGLVEGDRLEFGSGVINISEKSITSNGEYTINKDNDNDEGFKLYRDSSALSEEKFTLVTINIVDACDLTNPANSTAELHCPSAWSDKITDEMVTSANAKGWTIYIGGTLKTV